MTTLSKSKFALGAAVALAAMVAGAAVSAATVNHSADDSGTLTTSGLAGFVTSGGSTDPQTDMDGMTAKATFAGSADVMLTFADGTTTGAGFTLTQTTNTFSGTWTLSNTSSFTLTSLFLDGVPGDTIFDRTRPDPGTGDSASGRDYEDTSGLSGVIDVTYFNPVAVDPNAPLGDLYARMLIDFTGLTGGGLAAGGSLTFRQDTDNTKIAGDLNPIPVPGAGFLLVAGLAGLGAMKRRKKS